MKTGWPAELMQDDCRALSKWFAGRLGARYELEMMRMKYTLPNDVARCPGVSDAEGWRDGCEDCMRRTSPPGNPERVLWMAPPALITLWCESHIEPQK